MESTSDLVVSPSCEFAASDRMEMKSKYNHVTVARAVPFVDDSNYYFDYYADDGCGDGIIILLN